MKKDRGEEKMRKSVRRIKKKDEGKGVDDGNK